MATTTRLTWNRAAFATSYDVYLGTSSGSMVRVANVPAALVQNPPATYSWTPPSPLQGGTTYYWRVVSRTNATGVDPAIAAGSATRSFATSGTVPANPPATPSSPSPANGATGVSASPTLTWSATGATGYQVRFGTTNPPPSAATNLTSASYAPGSLAASTRYYWQVVAANASGTTTGSVWSFTTGAGSSPSPLPAPWQSRDVGNVGQPGSASYSNGRFTVSGAGADIWGSADGFHFLYQALSGDGVVTARLTSMQTTNAYAKAGVMLRTSLAANSPHVVLDMVPGGGIEFMRRTAAGGSTTYLGGTSGARPQWLRLSRSGDTISSFVSGDGSAWTAVGTTTVALGSTIYAGVVVCSHATAALNTSVFDQVTVSSGSGGTPQPPPPAATDVVIYASEIGAGAVHGSWSIGADAGSPNGVALVSTDSGFAANDAPLASPAHYVDVTFNAESGTPYRLWLRLKALNNSKYNDAVWVQFSDARVNGSPVYAIGSTAGLLVNLATGGTATSLNNWGWQNGAYWLSQATAVTFAASGGAHDADPATRGRGEPRPDRAQSDALLQQRARRADERHDDRGQVAARSAAVPRAPPLDEADGEADGRGAAEDGPRTFGHPAPHRHRVARALLDQGQLVVELRPRRLDALLDPLGLIQLVCRFTHSMFSFMVRTVRPGIGLTDLRLGHATATSTPATMASRPPTIAKPAHTGIASRSLRPRARAISRSSAANSPVIAATPSFSAADRALATSWRISTRASDTSCRKSSRMSLIAPPSSEANDAWSRSSPMFPTSTPRARPGTRRRPRGPTTQSGASR